MGQGIAAAIAARNYNRQEGQPIESIYGAVTSGEIWKFVKLIDTTASIDLSNYYIWPHLDRILGILIQG